MANDGGPYRTHPLGVGELIVPADEKSKAFVTSMVENGSAVEPPGGGGLPPGATHLIVDRTGEGLPVLQRARMSLA